MASNYTIFHKRNGVALLVLLVAALTIVMLVMLKPSSQTEYIIFGVIICFMWFIPSTIYYMLIVHYKKMINSDIIPNIVLSLTKTLQSMYDCNKYTPRQAEMIGQIAGETVVKSVLTKNTETKSDISDIIDSIRDPTTDELAHRDISDTYGLVGSRSLFQNPVLEEKHFQVPIAQTPVTAPQPIDTLELKARTELVAKRNVGIVEHSLSSTSPDISLEVKEASKRRDANVVSI